MKKIEKIFAIPYLKAFIMSASTRMTNMINNSQDDNGVNTNLQSNNTSATGFSPNGNTTSNSLQSQFAEDEHVELVYTPYVEDEEEMPQMKRARFDDGLDDSTMYDETQEDLRRLVEFRLMQAAREEEECYHIYSDDDDHYQGGMLREEYWADGLQEDSDGNFYWGDAEEEEW